MTTTSDARKRLAEAAQEVGGGDVVSDLPAWVIDLVTALERHTDEHPKYYAEYYPDYKMTRAATCGCEPLDAMPPEIRAALRNARST